MLLVIPGLLAAVTDHEYVKLTQVVVILNSVILILIVAVTDHDHVELIKVVLKLNSL